MTEQSEKDLIERLRDMADSKRVGSHFHPLYGEAADEIERLGRIRAEIIEECARVADNYPTSKFSCVAKQNIAVAIRALALSQADQKT